MSLHSCSRRPRCDKESLHHAKTSSKCRLPRVPTSNTLQLIFVPAMPRERGGRNRKEKSRLEVDAGAILDRNKSQNDPKVVQIRSARPSGRQNSRRSGRFVLFVSLVSCRLVVGSRTGRSETASGRLLGCSWDALLRSCPGGQISPPGDPNGLLEPSWRGQRRALQTLS